MCYCQDKTVNKVGYKYGEERIASLLVVVSYSSVKNYKTRVQPSKLKFLLGRHFATNSFGLGRLFYKSSRQLQ